MRSNVEELSLQNRQEKVDRWLSPSNPSTNYNKALEQRQHGTGQWFFQNESYLRWRTERGSLLWLYGIPGCGKTILSSTIIEELQKRKDISILLYFYFDFTDTHKQSLESVLRSLISQLYNKEEDVRTHLDLFYSCQSGGQQPSIKSLCTIFRDTIKIAGEVWIVLDALDECQTRKSSPDGGLFNWIWDLRNSQVNIHFLVTSRPEEDIESAIEEWVSDEYIICLQSNLMGEDIQAYIWARVREHKGLSRWKMSPDIQEEIEAALVEKANGM